MGRLRRDEADSKQVMSLLSPAHLVACPSGRTTRVRTAAGDVQVVNKQKCCVWKCLHGPAKFCGDPRRCARHFLPVVPRNFWNTGDYRGVSACAAAPPGLADSLRDLKCSEFIKYRALADGVEGAIHLSAIGGKCATRQNAVVSPASPQAHSRSPGKPSPDIPEPFPIDDPRRYQQSIFESTDVSRLILAAFTRKGVALTMVDDVFFRRAFEVCGLKLPSRSTFGKLRAIEAKQAFADNDQWFKEVQFGTLVEDGRVMKESRGRESLANFSFVNRTCNVATVVAQNGKQARRIDAPPPSESDEDAESEPGVGLQSFDFLNERLEADVEVASNAS